jgi:hypothetical protein
VPSIRVSVEGQQAAVVATAGLHVLSVHVSGTKVNEEFATLEFHGGTYPEGGPPTSLWWLSELQVRPGQTISVEFLPEAATSLPGKTIEELFPEESSPVEPSPKSREQLVEELRSTPQLRSHYGFKLRSSLGAALTCELPEGAHGFGFSVVWNWVRPERVSTSLHSYALEHLLGDGPLDYEHEERLPLGASVELRVDA